MNELTEAVNNAADTKLDKVESVEALDQAAQKWAVYCLSAMRGAMLRKGLNVSRALAEFVAEFEIEKAKP